MMELKDTEDSAKKWIHKNSQPSLIVNDVEIEDYKSPNELVFPQGVLSWGKKGFLQETGLKYDEMLVLTGKRNKYN